MIIAEECDLGMVFAQEHLIEALAHHVPELHGLFARLDIEQHLCREDAAAGSHEAEAPEELFGGGVGRHPHIGRTYLLEYPLDESQCM